MRNRKSSKEAARRTPSLTGDEGTIPAGGFLLTARLAGESRAPNMAQEGWEGLPVQTLFHAPVTLFVTVRNMTEDTLLYLTSNWEKSYRVEVSGGEIKREGTKVLRRETLSNKPPLTLHGSAINETPSGGYSAYGFRQVNDELEPGKSIIVRVLVDQIYDLSVRGMYQISVRHLFPVSPSVMTEFPNEYRQAFGSRQEIPEISAEAVSNPIYVRALRDAVSLVQDNSAEQDASDPER